MQRDKYRSLAQLSLPAVLDNLVKVKVESSLYDVVHMAHAVTWSLKLFHTRLQYIHRRQWHRYTTPHMVSVDILAYKKTYIHLRLKSQNVPIMMNSKCFIDSCSKLENIASIIFRAFLWQWRWVKTIKASVNMSRSMEGMVMQSFEFSDTDRFVTLPAFCNQIMNLNTIFFFF